jgi:hypothetical protein
MYFIKHQLVLYLLEKDVLKHIESDLFLQKDENVKSFMRYLDFLLHRGKFTLVAGKITFLHSQKGKRGGLKLKFYLRCQANALLGIC